MLPFCLINHYLKWEDFWINIYGVTDPKSRIAKLKQEPDVIEQELNQIKKNGIVVGWGDLRKREYLSHIMDDFMEIFGI